MYPCERTAEAKRKKRKDGVYTYGGASGPCSVLGWMRWSSYKKQGWGDRLKS